MKIYRRKIETPYGVMTALASEAGICALEWQGPRRNTLLERRFRVDDIVDGDSPHFASLESWLADYFKGKPGRLPPLDPRGSEFERRVWEVMLSIPPGETMSYSELAARVGIPKGARAAGGASRRNSISILIPCHRIVGKNGSLTGYGGGLENKQRLLEWENDSSR